MELKENLKNIRKEKGYTQEFLAEQLGISRQAIAKWESGKSFPSTENLIILSQILDVDIKLLIGTGKKPILKRPVLRGNITLFDDVLSFMNLDQNSVEEKYLISLMSNIECSVGLLNFVYGQKTIRIALGSDRTDWIGILTNIQNGIIPEAEEAVDVENYILNHFCEKQLVEATKYYLRMKGGSKKDAVNVVKKILCED